MPTLDEEKQTFAFDKSPKCNERQLSFLSPPNKQTHTHTLMHSHTHTLTQTPIISVKDLWPMIIMYLIKD